MKLLKDNVFVTYPHSLTTGQGDATVDTVLETPGFREIKRIYWEKYFQASVFIRVFQNSTFLKIKLAEPTTH